MEYAIVILSFCLIAALVRIGVMYNLDKVQKDRIHQLHQDKVGLTGTLNTRQERINGLMRELQMTRDANSTLDKCNQITLERNKELEAECDELKEDLRIAREETSYANESVRDLETLIVIKDEDLAYNDQYMQAQQRVLELSQDEINDLQLQLQASKSPEHLKACLLEKLQEVGNLKLINRHLENANNMYLKDLVTIKTEYRKMMNRLSETEFNNISLSGDHDPLAEPADAEMGPDLGPENCSSQQPQSPDESMNAPQVSACI